MLSSTGRDTDIYIGRKRASNTTRIAPEGQLDAQPGERDGSVHTYLLILPHYQIFIYIIIIFKCVMCNIMHISCCSPI